MTSFGRTWLKPEATSISPLSDILAMASDVIVVGLLMDESQEFQQSFQDRLVGEKRR